MQTVGQPMWLGRGGGADVGGAAGPPTQSSRAAEAETRIAADEWDADAWLTLASEVSGMPAEQACALYERLITRFPSCGRFWHDFAKHLINSDPDAAQSQFEKGVSLAPTSVELWRAYGEFVADKATAAPGTAAENMALEVYEKAVNTAGLDLSAHGLWQDYIEFLKNKATLPDTQRRDALRRIYQRSVRTPMQNLETFWQEYTSFEQKINTNKDFGRALLLEYQPKNVDARTEFRARKTRREGLALTALPVPPRGRAKETSQAQQWKRFVTQEQANPSSLPPDELHTRVVHAFESALAPLYRYPHMWIDYIAYMYDSLLPQTEVFNAASKPASNSAASAVDPAKLKQAVTVLEGIITRALSALPSCVALHTHVAWVWMRCSEPARAVSCLDNLCRKSPSPLAYVHLMRISRKVDGRDAARKVFARARKDPKGADPSVYVAAASMEFSVNKDSKVARNVFEFGLKNYKKSAVMAKEFVEWLWGLGDFEYMRVVFEKVMPEVQGPPEIVRALWERWIKVEDILGDTASVDRVEAMWKESGIGRSAGVVSNVLRRCRFLSFEGMNEEEMAVVEGIPAKTASSTQSGTQGPNVKRDPRTGRRVTSVATSAANISAQSGSTAVAAQNKSSSSTTATNGGAVGRSPGQNAVENLRRFAATLPPMTGPPPAVDMVVRLLLDTPDNFANTPAGASANGIAGRTQIPSGIPGAMPVVEDTQALNKKRKLEEQASLPVGGAMPLVNAGPNTGAAPAVDVFRSRQAAKQARLR